MGGKGAAEETEERGERSPPPATTASLLHGGGGGGGVGRGRGGGGQSQRGDPHLAPSPARSRGRNPRPAEGGPGRTGWPGTRTRPPAARLPARSFSRTRAPSPSPSRLPSAKPSARACVVAREGRGWGNRACAPFLSQLLQSRNGPSSAAPLHNALRGGARRSRKKGGRARRRARAHAPTCSFSFSPPLTFQHPALGQYAEWWS